MTVFTRLFARTNLPSGVTEVLRTMLPPPDLLAAAAAPSLGVTPASAQAFNQFIGFGNITVDSGWYYTHAPACS